MQEAHMEPAFSPGYVCSLATLGLSHVRQNDKWMHKG